MNNGLDILYIIYMQKIKVTYEYGIWKCIYWAIHALYLLCFFISFSLSFLPVQALAVYAYVLETG